MKSRRRGWRFSVPAVLKKSEILRGKDSFDKVFRYGEVIDTPHLRGIVQLLSISKSRPQRIVHVGFAARRGGLTAPERNRLKRLMRESYRLNKDKLLSRLGTSERKANIVFVYSPRTDISINSISYSTIEYDLTTILSTIASKWFSWKLSLPYWSTFIGNLYRHFCRPERADSIRHVLNMP